MSSTIIIGAGPAGLACAGALSKKGIPFQILEKSNSIAPSWVNHYDRLSLHTIKELSQLPHFPFPEEYPEYVPKNLLLEYYHKYCVHFNINPIFNTEVHTIKENEKGWQIDCKDGQIHTSNSIIICTGFNRIPNIPSWVGKESYAGPIIHSKDYKNSEQLPGNSVLVIGMGNSGAEIALDLSLNHKQVDLSVRGPVNIVPRDFLGNPTQKTAKKLAALPTFIGDRIGRMVQFLSMGNLRKYGLRPSKLFPAQQLREYGKTPVIDLGTVGQIKKGVIQVRPEIDKFDEENIHFKDSSFKSYDHVIMATGYHSKVEEFAPFVKNHLNNHGHPENLILRKDENKQACFVGFNAYASGLLESIHEQAIEVAEHLATT